MNIKERQMNTFEELMFQYLDRFKLLFFPEQWENLILNCSKNEIFVLLLIYRRGEVNMTEIADYINAPLNTATGIINRMEKKKMIQRERSVSDKRVVTVKMADDGLILMKEMIREVVNCGQKVMNDLSAQETQIIFKVVDKVIEVLQQENQKSHEELNKIPKVTRIHIN